MSNIGPYSGYIHIAKAFHGLAPHYICNPTGFQILYAPQYVILLTRPELCHSLPK